MDLVFDFLVFIRFAILCLLLFAPFVDGEETTAFIFVIPTPCDKIQLLNAFGHYNKLSIEIGRFNQKKDEFQFDMN